MRLDLVYKWLRSVLLADSQLTAIVGTRVYRRRIPGDPKDGSNYPCVVINYVGGPDIKANGNILAMSDARFDVKAVDRGITPAVIDPAADRISAVLDGARGTATGIEVFACTRVDSAIDYFETVAGGENYWHFGHTFRVHARPA
jgi:hypothetical protein